MKTPKTSTLRNKLTIIFNKFIRLRDMSKGCISCLTGRCENAGHFIGVGADPRPSIRFDEMNVHGQCIHCNHTLEGNKEAYRKGLTRRHGKEVVEKLEIKRSLPQNPWTAFEYQAMIKHYQQRLKQMEDYRGIEL